MDVIDIANYTIALLLIILIVLLYLYIKYKKRDVVLEKELLDYGVSVRLSHKERKSLKKGLERRFSIIKEMSYTYYLSCDNFSMHRESLANTFTQIKENNSIGNLCSDIVAVSNLCVNGAFSALAVRYKLTPQETRACCFLYWGFKWQQTCTLEGISENAYYVKCSRIRKKFGLTKDEDIPTFIKNFTDSFGQ